MRVASRDLLPRVLKGEVAAIARLLSRAEAADPECRETLGEIYARAGKSHVIGITGVPGSGKSTMVAVLGRRLREAGHKVGIIAIDPSSPYSGGSIMGDRIRMSELAGDEGVYIRSMATRGALGGMARATLDSVDILDVAGYDYIVIETVGVGQDEVEIASASHTTLVVSAPGLGDEIQAIKAGILEIADVHVVSKSDRPDARGTISDLKQMLALGLSIDASAAWRPPVVATSSLKGEGFEELVAALEKHKAFLEASEAGRARSRKIAEFRMLKTAEDLLRIRFHERSAGLVRGMADRLVSREISPYAAGEQLIEAMGARNP
ncbi:MAG: LAO/AO ABC transporter ATP-binding protein [Deltaproteobacteria bacterium 13_1_20CM_2_69_21]|nr:MAG: LAO/AO ABC transporter ATP-binding protein [Deltaproteobacteria bacterium 13_1_40CM_4_68_19]OLD07092.1 MAG: LAO/AO ABC transporter ATP-binding protein [Deltaproteobacteria bacterium 13_1_40CM_3_69_14]OLE61776.1 MAG: LAO/AO ABC transporter ATP-binding protein [Deltaproteobacteria bacterium 13_1_20CM_2_69_21]